MQENQGLSENLVDKSGFMEALVKKIMKIIGCVLLTAIILVTVFLLWNSIKPAVPGDYETAVETGGEIEAQYLAHGSHEVKYTEQKVLENYKKYEVYYPADLENDKKSYPLIVISNGTGVKGSKAKKMFEHFASWGFIVIGNEEEYSWNGFSAEMSLKYLLRENENKNSIFYQKIDAENISALGHSQGGVGAFNASHAY